MNISIKRKNGPVAALVRHAASDEGVTFLEVLVTFVMLVAAIIITFHSIFLSNHALDLSMRKQQAMRLVQQEVEYWVGRMYVNQLPGDPTPDEMLPKNHYKKISLDAGTSRQVDVWLSRDQIVERIDTSQPGEQPQRYWVITVYAEWTEPDGQQFNRSDNLAISLTTYASGQPG
ncbi:MAG: hypothetical protein NTW14_09340 [bacterium]|nr:hypothetical protein [bacterium]